MSPQSRGTHIRLRIEVRLGPESLVRTEAVALVNSGYQAGTAELILPEELAQARGLWPAARPHAEEKEYRAASGDMRVFRLRGLARVQAVARDRESGWVDCDLVIQPGAHRVLMSAQLTEDLEVVLLKPASGVWKFADEGDTRRPSEPPEVW